MLQYFLDFIHSPFWQQPIPQELDYLFPKLMTSICNSKAGTTSIQYTRLFELYKKFSRSISKQPLPAEVVLLRVERKGHVLAIAARRKALPAALPTTLPVKTPPTYHIYWPPLADTSANYIVLG